MEKNSYLSKAYYQENRVEAFLFDGQVIKDGIWSIPDWLVSEFDKSPNNRLVINIWEDGKKIRPSFMRCKENKCASCFTKCEVSSDFSFHENYKVYSLYYKFSKLEEPIKIELSEEPVYIVYLNPGDFEVFREEEFKKYYIGISYIEELERVDIPKELPYSYKPLPLITGEWIYIPPDKINSKFYMIRCSNCGCGYRILNTQENSFSRIIAPKHYCSNCGAEMSNSNLPKRSNTDE